MGEIIILDKNKAEQLKTMGFNCVEDNVSGTVVFKFINTTELRKVLSENFSSLQFFVSDTVNF